MGIPQEETKNKNYIMTIIVDSRQFASAHLHFITDSIIFIFMFQ